MKITRIFPILLILSCLFFTSTAQKNQYGQHFIQNYNQEDYNSSPQNYSVVQDNRGVLYFGNQGEIIEYDGNTWKHIPITNKSFVQSLAVDKQGTVYAGALGEFGYLKPDKKGKLEYVSLSSDIDSSFQYVYNIFTEGDYVYFSSYKYIFKFKNDSLVDIIYADIAENHFWDFFIDGKYYLSNYVEGLMRLKEGEIVTAKGGDFYKNNDILLILPYAENQYLIGVQDKSYDNKFYIYDFENGTSKSINQLGQNFRKLNNFIKEKRLYGGLRLQDGNYLFNTITNGVIIVDKETGKIKYHYTDKNGLLDNTVIDAYESRRGNIWLGLNTGISSIEYNSPFNRFGKESGLKSIKLDLIKFKERIFVSTNVQIYEQLFDEKGFPHFEQIEGLRQGRKFLLYEDPNTHEKRLLLATHLGIFDITNPDKKFNIYSETTERVFKGNQIIQSKYYPGKIYVGATSGLVCFKYKGNSWQYMGEDKNIEEDIQFLIEDSDSVLWAATEINGLLKINLNTKDKGESEGLLKKLESTIYDTSKGLPANDNNKIFQIDGRNYFATEEGFYKYDKNRDIFIKDTALFEGHYNDVEVLLIKKDNKNSFWVIYKEEDEHQRIDKVLLKGDSVQFVQRPFKRLGESTSYFNLYDEEGDMTWIVTGKDIYSYDNSFIKNYDQDYHALIRSVSLAYDSVLFKGAYYEDTIDYKVSIQQPDYLNYELDYRHNNIFFTYTAPFFEGQENVQYSYQLKGYDEGWSNWSSKSDKEYTNLDAGRYTFFVKARNIYGIESKPATFTFSVLPPWYQTIWAYLGYVIVAVSLVILIVKWYTRRLEQEKVRLEKIVQERTKEVVAQKNQIEQQRDEIVKKNQDITDSIEYASKIQNAVLPKSEFTDKVLPEYFVFYRPRDIVSGDFYWIDQKDGFLIVIAADCTGHGVPGAFMSMLGVSLLNEIVNKHETTQANEILNELRDEVKHTLRQTGEEGEAKDGMDIALTVLDLGNMKMQYAGAYNPLYLFRDGELIQYKADRMPIGIYVREKPTFTNHEIDIQKGDTFYVFSDGFQDQFGGEDGSKFKAKRLKDVLASIQDKPMAEQKRILDRTFDEWKGDHEQLDDVILIGVRI